MAPMGLEMPITSSFTSQHPPPVLARPNSSLKTPPTQLKLVVSIGDLSAAALPNIRSYFLPHQGPPGYGWGPILLCVQSSIWAWQQGTGEEAGGHTGRSTQAYTLLLYPLTSLLPTCSPVPTCSPLLPPAQPLKSQTLNPQPRTKSHYPSSQCGPGAILLPHHVGHDPELQQPLQGAHPPVPGYHILLRFVIQKPPARQGPRGAHASSSCCLLGHMSQHSSCSHS